MTLQLRTLALGLIVIIGGAIAWWMQGDGDEAQIHGIMDDIAELLSVEGELGQVERLGRARKASDFFVSKPSVRALGYSKALNDKEAVMTATIQALSMVSNLDVSFSQRSLTINEDATKAILECTGNADGMVSGSEQQHRARYRLEFIKHEGQWLIESVEMLDG